MINVVWSEAVSYARWLSSQTGQTYRLPTEAEWEYAARAGTTTPFHTGDFITSDQANFQALQSYNGSPVGVFRNETLPVGSFPPNAFGLHDMHGNAMEWTCSAFVGDYRSPAAPQQCDSTSTGRRSLRGGSWSGVARNIRSAWRNSLSVNFRNRSIGFRVVKQ